MIFLFLVITGTGWSINVYAQAQGPWEQLDPISKARMAIASCAVGQNIYIFGGWTVPVLPLADGEIYNIDTGSELSNASLPNPIFKHTTTKLCSSPSSDCDLLIAGGQIPEKPKPKQNKAFIYYTETKKLDTTQNRL